MTDTPHLFIDLFHLVRGSADGPTAINALTMIVIAILVLITAKTLSKGK